LPRLRSEPQFALGLSVDRDALQSLSEESAQRLQELAVIQDGQAAETTRLETERKNRKEVLARISAQVARQRREASVLERDARRLTKLVEELARLLAARKPLRQKSTNERSPEPRAEGTAFQNSKADCNYPYGGNSSGASAVLWRAGYPGAG